MQLSGRCSSSLEVVVHQHGCNMVCNDEYLKYGKCQGLFECLFESSRRIYGDVRKRRLNVWPFGMVGSWIMAPQKSLQLPWCHRHRRARRWHLPTCGLCRSRDRYQPRAISSETRRTARSNRTASSPISSGLITKGGATRIWSPTTPSTVPLHG